MLNITEILFLVFGWIYNLKGLIITSLVISVFFMLVSLAEEGKKIRAADGNYKPPFKLGLLIQVICLALSIVKLCM
jgi:hypothetical protein